MIKAIFFTTFLLMFLGCTAKTMEPKIDFEPPVYVEQMPAKEEETTFNSGGSIFGSGDNPLFSDHKAIHVNDIVTVVISENAKSSNSSNKALKKSDTTDLNGGVFAGGGANTGINNAATDISGVTNVGFNASTNNAFSGQGSYTKDATFTTTVSARVVKVLENNNYYISGRREIMIDGEKQIIQISGVIRPYDINQNNQINSAQMSDAKILYENQGDVNRATNQGWATSMLQAIWPF